MRLRTFLKCDNICYILEMMKVMKMRNDLGDSIKLFRERKGWTQKELGECLGLGAVSAVSNWEAGISKPELDKFIAICQELEVSPSRLLGMSDGDLDLSHEEETLIKKYRQLDALGKGEVHSMLEDNLKRCGYYIEGEPVEVSFPIFIRPGHPDYEAVISGCKELRKLRRKKKASYEDIFHHLVQLSPIYDDHLCVFFIMAILRGSRCPSRELYSRIYAYLLQLP